MSIQDKGDVSNLLTLFLKIVFSITFVRDAAEPQTLVTFPKI